MLHFPDSVIRECSNPSMGYDWRQLMHFRGQRYKHVLGLCKPGFETPEFSCLKIEENIAPQSALANLLSTLGLVFGV